MTFLQLRSECRFIKQRVAPSCGQLTHAISLALKMRGSTNILTGTVRMRTKGKASDAWVDITAQRTPKHTTWMQVNRCIRSVRTWRDERPSLKTLTRTGARPVNKTKTCCSGDKKFKDCTRQSDRNNMSFV